jgi:hypothetical protein
MILKDVVISDSVTSMTEKNECFLSKLIHFSILSIDAKRGGGGYGLAFGKTKS